MLTLELFDKQGYKSYKLITSFRNHLYTIIHFQNNRTGCKALGQPETTLTSCKENWMKYRISGTDSWRVNWYWKQNHLLPSSNRAFVVKTCAISECNLQDQLYIKTHTPGISFQYVRFSYRKISLQIILHYTVIQPTTLCLNTFQILAHYRCKLNRRLGNSTNGKLKNINIWTGEGGFRFTPIFLGHGKLAKVAVDARSPHGKRADGGPTLLLWEAKR